MHRRRKAPKRYEVILSSSEQFVEKRGRGRPRKYPISSDVVHIEDEVQETFQDEFQDEVQDEFQDEVQDEETQQAFPDFSSLYILNDSLGIKLGNSLGISLTNMFSGTTTNRLQNSALNVPACYSR